MATFAKNAALIQEVYIRRVLAGGVQKYLRLPFNLVRYDDGGGVYIEPLPYLGNSGLANTFAELNPPSSDGEFLIVDRPPYHETFNLD